MKESFDMVYQYASKLGYATDGVLFYQKDSFYLHEVNPDVFLWKDLHVAPSLSN